MIRRTLSIKNELGLHARAAAKLVGITSQFESDIQLARRDTQQHVDGKSILGILLLAASKGTKIQIITEGEDEQEAMESIVSLIQRRFDEVR